MRWNGYLSSLPGSRRWSIAAIVPRILDGELELGNKTDLQAPVIVRCVQNRTLEVRGSIPLGFTRKRSRRVEIRGGFVFGNRHRSAML